jgi:DNA-binding NarL/FixJ family response regulator
MELKKWAYKGPAYIDDEQVYWDKIQHIRNRRGLLHAELLELDKSERLLARVRYSGHATAFLSPREIVILNLLQLTCGPNKDIAKQLNITERTVKFHISNLLRKFGVSSRIALLDKSASVLLGQTQGATA